MNRPDSDIYNQNPVKMIRHHNPFIQFDFIIDFTDIHPFMGNNFPRII